MLSKETIQKAKHYDNKAVAKICDNFYSKIYHYLFYRTRNKEDAEDLTHEVFLRMVKNIKNQKGNFESWIFSIARNLLTDYYRKRARTKTDNIENQKGIKVEDSSENTLNWSDLKRALKQIPPEQQEVIVLKLINGLRNKQIAQIMNKSEGAVKALQYRAVRSLKKILMRDEK